MVVMIFVIMNVFVMLSSVWIMISSRLFVVRLFIMLSIVNFVSLISMIVFWLNVFLICVVMISVVVSDSVYMFMS